jgi:uncharacterized Zn finger protein
MGYFRFPKYVSVAEKKASATKKRNMLKKKDPSIQPVIIQGRTLAKTWWGKAWNDNLTKYADFENRVGRGRSYLRHGAVLDLKIRAGEVSALVQGGDYEPYDVQIVIQKISKSTWNDIKLLCVGKIDSLQELLHGKFPKVLADVFTSKDSGLFPTPKAINFSCSCPDWASMCKHVAAVLYGIGTRLDDDPMLFFKLRGVNGNDLVAQAVKENTNQLLERAKKKSERVMDDIDISDVFGIDMESAPDKSTEKPEKKEIVQPKVKKKKQTPKKKRSKTKIQNNSPDTRTQKATKLSELDMILKVIKRSRKGIDIPTLQKRTGIEDRQRLYNAVYRLCEKNKIYRVARGVYRCL